MSKLLKRCLRPCRRKFQCFIVWLVRNPSVPPGKHLGFFCGLEVAALLERSPEDSCKIRIIAPDWESWYSSCFHLAFSWASAVLGWAWSAAGRKVTFSFHLRLFCDSPFWFNIMLIILRHPICSWLRNSGVCQQLGQKHPEKVNRIFFSEHPLRGKDNIRTIMGDRPDWLFASMHLNCVSPYYVGRTPPSGSRA